MGEQGKGMKNVLCQLPAYLSCTAVPPISNTAPPPLLPPWQLLLPLPPQLEPKGCVGDGVGMWLGCQNSGGGRSRQIYWLRGWVSKTNPPCNCSTYTTDLGGGWEGLRNSAEIPTSLPSNTNLLSQQLMPWKLLGWSDSVESVCWAGR